MYHREYVLGFTRAIGCGPMSPKAQKDWFPRRTWTESDLVNRLLFDGRSMWTTGVGRGGGLVSKW